MLSWLSKINRRFHRSPPLFFVPTEFIPSWSIYIRFALILLSRLHRGFPNFVFRTDIFCKILVFSHSYLVYNLFPWISHEILDKECKRSAHNYVIFSVPWLYLSSVRFVLGKDRSKFNCCSCLFRFWNVPQTLFNRVSKLQITRNLNFES